MSKPRWKHHCKNCVFLGHHDRRDLYYCEKHRLFSSRDGIQQGRRFLCRRYGIGDGVVGSVADEFWHYMGAIAEFMSDRTAFIAALRLAARAGLICKCDAEAALAGVPL